MDLIADIGATNSRCALLDDKGRVLSPEEFRNADFTGVAGLVDVYLKHRRRSDKPTRAALAIAAPVTGDEVRMTNIDWAFSKRELERALELSELLVVNDFEALAWALPGLGPDDVRQVGGGRAVPRSPMAVIGPGSGLGVAGIVPALDSWAVVSGEGGHVTLPAVTDEEHAVVAAVRERRGRCSAEMLLSGPGLVELYTTLAALHGREGARAEPRDVTALAAKGEPLAVRTLGMFFAMLGTVATDLALVLGARGGVYIGGGIVPRIVDALESSAFRARFVDAGVHGPYLDTVPTCVITRPLPALAGLRYLLGYR